MEICGRGVCNAPQGFILRGDGGGGWNYSPPTEKLKMKPCHLHFAFTLSLEFFCPSEVHALTLALQAERSGH
jgi:hypothetical protein